MTATSGLRRSELSVRWDRDTSSWKTYQVSFLHLLMGEPQRMGEPWSESLPPSGTVSIGEQSELTMWAHPTVESGGGALQPWMTPNTMDSLNPKTQEALDHEYTHREGRSNPNNLRDQVSVQQGETNWPTPDSSPRGPRAEDLMVDGKMQVQRRESGQQRGMDLQTATTHWPTPTATPYGTGNNYKVNEGQPAAHSPGLDTLTKNWATPQQRDHRSAEGSAPRWANPQRSRNLNDQVYSSSPLGPQVPQIQTHGSESSENVQTSPRPSTKKLNPSFVEWLMGLPIGWTSLQPMTELTD